jgi:hypothetical protein
MHDFFVDNEEGQVWLISKYHKGLNKPDWEIIMPSASTLNDPPKPIAALASAFAGLSLFHEDTSDGDALGPGLMPLLGSREIILTGTC